MLSKLIKSFIEFVIKHYKVFIAFVVVVVFLLSASLFDYFFSNKIFHSEYKNYYKVYNIRIPHELYFAHSKVPVDEEYVRKAIAREILKNTHWKNQVKLLHSRSIKWFPVIEPILAAYHVPDDFKYIALVESNLTNATSPKGAVGFWQLIKSTGEQHGLVINEYVDERLHVVKSTEAACRFFKYSYKELNDWTLVAAAYNKGVGGIQSRLKKQHKNNYYELRLNKETAVYVYKVIAMKELISNHKSYGIRFFNNGFKRKLNTKKIVVDSTIHNLEKFAAHKKTDYIEFQELNPWLLKDKLPNEEGKKYVIEVLR